MDKEKDIPTMQGRNGGTLLAAGTGAGGRPRKIPAIDTILANVLGEERDINGETISAAEAILKSLLKQAMKGNVQAAKLLLERGYGLPKQTIEHSGEIGPAEQRKTIEVLFRDRPTENESKEDSPTGAE